MGEKIRPDPGNLLNKAEATITIENSTSFNILKSRVDFNNV